MGSSFLEKREIGEVFGVAQVQYERLIRDPLSWGGVLQSFLPEKAPRRGGILRHWMPY